MLEEQRACRRHRRRQSTGNVIQGLTLRRGIWSTSGTRLEEEMATAVTEPERRPRGSPLGSSDADSVRLQPDPCASYTNLPTDDLLTAGHWRDLGGRGPPHPRGLKRAYRRVDGADRPAPTRQACQRARALHALRADRRRDLERRLRLRTAIAIAVLLLYLALLPTVRGSSRALRRPTRGGDPDCSAPCARPYRGAAADSTINPSSTLPRAGSPRPRR